MTACAYLGRPGTAAAARQMVAGRSAAATAHSVSTPSVGAPAAGQRAMAAATACAPRNAARMAREVATAGGRSAAAVPWGSATRASSSSPTPPTAFATASVKCATGGGDGATTAVRPRAALPLAGATGASRDSISDSCICRSSTPVAPMNAMSAEAVFIHSEASATILEVDVTHRLRRIRASSGSDGRNSGMQATTARARRNAGGTAAGANAASSRATAATIAAGVRGGGARLAAPSS